MVKPLSIKTNIIWNSIGSIIYLVCQWLITIFVVRLSTGYDDAGLLALAMSVVGIFGTFANYKMGVYQISDIKNESTVGEYFGFRCITLAIAGIACIVYTLITCPLEAFVTVMLYFIYKGIGLLIDILHGLDQKNRRMDYIGRSFIFQGVASLVCFVGVYFLSANLNLSIAIMTVATVIVLVVYDRPKARQFEKLVIRISKNKIWYYLKTSFPAVLAAIAASAILTVPKQYLFFLFGDSSLGIYASVAAPALIIQMGAVYLYTPLLDIFPSYFSKGEFKQFKNLLSKTVLGILGVSFAASILLAFGGSFLLQLLFGESIAPYVYLLQPIILATAANAYLWFFSDLMISLREFRANLMGNSIAFITAIPLSFLFVNIWNMNGVSFTGAVACLVGVCFLAFSLRRKLKAAEQSKDDSSKQSEVSGSCD